MERNLYLSNTPLEEAKERYFEALFPLLQKKEETVAAAEALGRITARAVFAKLSSPLYTCAAMDGIAVRSEKTRGARETAPLLLQSGEDYMPVDTGDPVKPPYDAVIMAEDILETEANACRILAAAHPWQNLRPVGEDIAAGEMILPSNHKIRSVDIGVLLSAGVTALLVLAKPAVAIIPTGTELIEPGVTPGEGDIIESNSRMFAAMTEEQGGRAVRFKPVADDRAAIKKAVAEACQSFDLVLLNAGSSAGREDYTFSVLEELGKVVIHGVAVKPGKPVILALVEGKSVVGLPGYPVSAYIAFMNFVSPVLEKLSGQKALRWEEARAVAARAMVSNLKYLEYVRVKLGVVNNVLTAAPLSRGAGAAMSLVRADGFAVIEQNREGVEAGETVPVLLFRPMSEISDTLVSVGSHDLLLDVLADMLSSSGEGYALSSAHVGSMGGLLALKRGEAHIAPTHLLDAATGEYNVPTIKKLFNEPMALIKGVERIQGILVKKGNPLNIRSVCDIPGKRYVNRQRGAGTRVLFDYLLKKEGIAPEKINGYDREASTHMAVAALVQSEDADCGMGVLSAANAMGLDFVEAGVEEYDFALRQRDLELPQTRAFLRALGSAEFKEALRKMGGYRQKRTGEILLIGEKEK